MAAVLDQWRLAIAAAGMGLATLIGSAPCTAAGNGWGGSVVATTDYVFRGLSQTQGEPALQGDLHYRGETGWFAGAWMSNIGPVSDYAGKLEINAYAGWAWSLAPDWSARVTYVRYLYPDASAGYNYDYGDLTFAAAYRDRVFAVFAWSPDMARTTISGLDRRGNALSAELSVRQPVWRSVAVAAGVGYYDLHDLFNESYWSWNVGLAGAFGDFEVDLSRFGNDATARELFGTATAGDRWALTAIWRF